MKKLFVSVLTAGLLFTGIGSSASAATVVNNDILANINGGSLDLIMDTDADLVFEGEINKDEAVLTPTLVSDPIEFTVKDNRGVTEKSIVQVTLTDFIHEEGDVLNPIGQIVVGSPMVVATIDPSDNREFNGTIGLDGLAFDNSGFVKAGQYTSTLTTEVVAAPEL